MSERRYLEDLTVGETRLSSVYEVSEEEAVEFARRFDPQDIHINKAAAEQGMFRGLIASGWHTAAIAMKMMAEVAMFGSGDVLGLGVDKIRWPGPVRPGDRLQGEVRIGAIRPSEKNPAYGIVRLDVTVRNQNGDIVLTESPNCWVPRRLA